MPRTSLIALAATFTIVTVTACRHHDPAPVLGPVAARANPDSEAALARAQRDAARRDSVARADAASREAARLDADRRTRLAADRMTLARPVFFEYDDGELTTQARASLDTKLPILRAHPTLRIRIDGNTDERGTPEYNLALGQRRAASAKRYLLAAGIEESRIETASYGEERRACDGEDDTCQQRNRRDEFVVTAGAM
ncbi:MAG: OmpA family protein [Gemmatimonadota bacterium]